MIYSQGKKKKIILDRDSFSLSVPKKEDGWSLWADGKKLKQAAEFTSCFFKNNFYSTGSWSSLSTFHSAS